MQTGYVQAADAIIRQLVMAPVKRDRQRKQVNVLCSVGCTAADVETLRRYIEAFEIDAVFIPDLSRSLDGHLTDEDYAPTSTGGTSVLEVEMMSESELTLVIGPSFEPTAKWLQARFNIPYLHLGMGMTIDQTDQLIMALSELSGVAVPAWINRARTRLQDAMIDSHFLLSNERFVIGLEPDLASGYCELLDSVGGQVVQVVTSIDAPVLRSLKALEIEVGDLSRIDMQGNEAKLLISNTHAAQITEPDYPVLRAGYPVLISSAIWTSGNWVTKVAGSGCSRWQTCCCIITSMKYNHISAVIALVLRMWCIRGCMKISERKLHVEPRPEEEAFTLKVAFATHDRKNVDQHFGSCKSMLVYGVNVQEWHLLEAIEYAELPADTHNKLPARISDLTGCAAVFCNACGASAIRQLLEKNIHPVKVTEGREIHELLVTIQDELAGEPGGWLARAIKRKEQEDEPEGRKHKDFLNSLMKNGKEAIWVILKV